MLVLDQVKATEVVRALSDEYSRRIVLSIITKALPIEEISKEQQIPISTCYRRVHELEQFGIIRAAKTIIQEDGKKFVCYKASFKNASINLESGELRVDLVSNRDEVSTEKQPNGAWPHATITERAIGAAGSAASTIAAMTTATKQKQAVHEAPLIQT